MLGLLKNKNKDKNKNKKECQMAIFYFAHANCAIMAMLFTHSIGNQLLTVEHAGGV